MYVKRMFSFFSKRNGATILMNFGQGHRNQFRMGGGGGKNFCGITLTFPKDTHCAGFYL